MKALITNLDAVRERLTASPVKAVANEIIKFELTRECAEWLVADIDKRRKRIGQCVSDANTRQRKREKREQELHFVALASDAINNALNNSKINVK
ncbi:MAG: hypothetical protein ACI4SO_04195 [Muribaculaceae bacterium]